MTGGGLQPGTPLERGVRLGLVVYGAIHLVIAAIALQLAFGDAGGTAASQRGAFAQLAQESWGRVVLLGMAAGFALLVVWQALEAVTAYRDKPTAEQWRKRVGSAGRCVVYGVLGYSAVSTAITGSSGSEQSSSDSLTAQVMSAPGGQLIVGAIGLGIIAVGLYLAFKGVTRRFTEQLEGEATAGDTEGPVKVVGIVGHVGKGTALAAVGVLFGIAAIEHQPKESGGLDVALHQLLRQPFGGVLTAALAVGLGAYGLYCLVWARHLRR